MFALCGGSSAVGTAVELVDLLASGQGAAAADAPVGEDPGTNTNMAGRLLRVQNICSCHRGAAGNESAVLAAGL